MELEQLVAFCILMENGEGIITKAPSYLMEKYESCSMRNSRSLLMGLLDMYNQAKFKRYLEMWRIDKEAK